MFSWFKKKKPQPPVLQLEPPRGELGLEHQMPAETEDIVIIQQLCFIACLSGERALLAKAEGRLGEARAQSNLKRYIRLRTECAQLADALTDECYRAIAINCLINVCMKAGDVDDAHALFRFQSDEPFREEIVRKYPELMRPSAPNFLRKSA
jgi:pentatricopeptide repeat protein